MSESFSIVCPECHQSCTVQVGKGMQFFQCSLCKHEWMEPEWVTTVRKGQDAARALKGELKDITAQREMLLGFLHDIRKATGVYMFGSALVAGLKEMREQHDQQFQELVETTKERDVLRTENEILKEGTFYCAPIAPIASSLHAKQELKEKLDRMIKDRDHLARENRKLNDLLVQLSKVLELETPSDGSLIRAAMHSRNQRIALEQDVKRAHQSLAAAQEEQDRLITAKNDLRAEIAELKKEREARIAEAQRLGLNSGYLDDLRTVLGIRKFGAGLVEVVAELKKKLDTATETNVAYETVRAQVWRALGTNWGASIVKTAEAIVAERDMLRKQYDALQQRIADAPIETVFVTCDSWTLIHGYKFNKGDRVALVLMKEAGK